MELACFPRVKILGKCPKKQQELYFPRGFGREMFLGIVSTRNKKCLGFFPRESLIPQSFIWSPRDSQGNLLTCELLLHGKLISLGFCLPRKNCWSLPTQLFYQGSFPRGMFFEVEFKYKYNIISDSNPNLNSNNSILNLLLLGEKYLFSTNLVLKCTMHEYIEVHQRHVQNKPLAHEQLPPTKATTNSYQIVSQLI